MILPTELVIKSIKQEILDSLWKKYYGRNTMEEISKLPVHAVLEKENLLVGWPGAVIQKSIKRQGEWLRIYKVPSGTWGQRRKRKEFTYEPYHSQWIPSISCYF